MEAVETRGATPMAVLRAVEHRPWPLPGAPWVMTQTWRELLFAHWPVAAEALQPLLPAGLPLDTFDGRAWVGVVPFRMTGVRPRGLPTVRGLSAFPELNVRTYVATDEKPGVYFFSLDAGNPIAVAVARSLFHLPYYTARMRCERVGETIDYTSARTHRGAASAAFKAQYRPIGPPFTARPGSLERWLTERYCLYTTGRGGQLLRGEITHGLWPLQPAEATIEVNTMAASHGIALPASAPLLHYADRQDVLVWNIRRVR